MNDEISYYVRNILKKQLQKLKVSNYGLYSIMKSVEDQLRSIIYNWHDLDFKRAILVIGSEEGNFYEPNINIDVSNMVVVGIRNSLLEVIASVDYKQYGLQKDISSDQIKEITSSAIKYFSNIDLDDLSKSINLEVDLYKEVIKKYPVAWKAIFELSKCDSINREHSYEEIEFKEPYVIDELKQDSNNFVLVNYESGISDEFNESLIQLLKGIQNKESSFIYVDSFKYLTRNFEKLLKVLEFVLTNDALFITNNYLMTKDYVSRRKEIVRANHGRDINYENISSISKVSNKYESLLTDLENMLKEID